MKWASRIVQPSIWDSLTFQADPYNALLAWAGAVAAAGLTLVLLDDLRLWLRTRRSSLTPRRPMRQAASITKAAPEPR